MSSFPHQLCHPSADLADCRLDSGVSIYRFAELRNCRLGKDCVVGDFSRLRDCEFEHHVRIDRHNFALHTSIGAYSYTGARTHSFHCSIGRFCSISWGVSIGPGEHDHSRLTSHDFLYNESCGLKPPGAPTYDRFVKPCRIGHDVWIGANATILRGAEIGHGAVIGANSTVTQSIPPYAIAVGSPARVKRYRFSQKVIDALVALAWWDLPPALIREHFSLVAEPPNEKSLAALRDLKSSFSS